jgi:hypothetical protein
MKIMEDFEFCQRVRRHVHYKIMPGEVLISARKYDTRSWLKVQLAYYAAIFGLVSVGGGAGVSLVWFAVHGIEVTVGAAALAALGAKMMLIGAAWSAIGVGVGLIVGHQVAALVGSLLYGLVIEDLIGAFAGGVAKYLPGGAADAVVGLAPGGMTVLAPATGAMLIAAWVAVSVVAGERRLQGRDIA